MTLYYVAVGGVQQVVVIVEAVLRDGVIHKVMMQVQVHHQLRCKGIVNQRYVMSLLYIQVGVTVAQCNGVGLINVWVQVRDTRARDAHVVGKTEVRTLRDGVLHAGCWNQATVTGTEVLTVTQVVLYILPSVLVAQTCLETELTKVAYILAITGQDRVLVLVVGA